MSNKDIINRYILEGVKNGNFEKEMSLMILKEINQTREAAKEDVAIVGLACKFPCAGNANEYWSNLKNGAEVIGNFPKDRERDIGEKVAMQAGWLDNIGDFDAGFFRISPKEAILMHPSQRLFLETAWEAIEDAGYANDGIYGSKTGVYVGIDHTYQMEYNKMTEQQDLLAMTGSMTSVLAGRIAYILNLHGPNLVVDTACSSGLVATHLAYKAIRNKECTMALAGGINILRLINRDFGGVESDNGKLCSFDKNSNGTVWGEGIGFILMKPYEQALKDKDNIYAIIKGSAVNNDGATNGITAPSAETQSEAIVSAWEDAGIDPETISYMEAHATGTVLGDPIEVKGIKTAFEKYTDRKQFCGIGSVKPNIGHGVSAAAISSLIKVILAMRNKQLPPNINFSRPNPFIEFFNSPLYVNDQLKDWETDGIPRRAGISSFGFSRTNCHMVLEEAPEIKKPGDSTTKEDKPCIFTLSARSENALKEYIENYNIFVNENSEFNLMDLCYTANTGRMHYSNRLALVLEDKQDFINKLRKLRDINLKEINDANIVYKEHRVIADNMQNNLQGEINKKEKREIDNKCAEKLSELGRTNIENHKKVLNEICAMYVSGADVHWVELYHNEACRKISLPTYPFEHKHYWMKQPETKTQANTFSKELAHPLIDKRLISTLDQEVYMTEFSVERHWILTDHIIMDLNVVPGVTYLEMAREACSNFCRSSIMELKDVVFLTPLLIDKQESKEVHTIVSREDTYTSFKIASKINSENDEEEPIWAVHAEGKAYSLAKEDLKIVDVAQFRSRCNKGELIVDTRAPMGGFKFGPRWRNVSKIYVGENEIFTELGLHESFADDIKEFVLHPSLLDNSINLAIENLVQNVEEGMYLPLSYKSLKIYGSMPAKFYSYQKINSQMVKNIQTVSLDVTLINEAGEVFVEVQGYVIKKVHKDTFSSREARGNAEQYNEVSWALQDITQEETKSNLGNVLVIKDDTGIADKVIEKLKAENINVMEVSYGDRFRKIDSGKFQVNSNEEDFIKLVEELKNSRLTQIIHMMSIVQNSEVNSLEELEDSKNRGIYSLFYLTRALVANKVSNDLEIVLVSKYVNEVTKREKIIHPHNAPLFVLGKVVGNEYNGISCRAIDIDDSTTTEQIIKEFSSSTEIYQVAYRDRNRYVEEFREFNMEAATIVEVDIKDSGVYLITGGTGGIGLEVAKYLASRNKVNIAFINRSKLPERETWDDILASNDDKKLCSKLKAIKEVESTGSKVVCCSSDVTSAEEMKTVIEGLRVEFGRINGIIHSAGVAGEGVIIRTDIDKFKQVIAPKIEGTWLLDRLTQEDQPDFFIMFSSILAIVGVMGQSAYASGNAYMDSFAAYRKIKGGKTSTINWTVWNETGMALEYNTNEVRGVFKPVTNARGIEAFVNVLNKDITRLTVGGLDYERINSVESDIGINLSPEFKVKVEKKCARIKASKAQDKKQSINVVIKGEVGANEIEMQLAQIWAEVLGVEELNLYDSFNELGGDSIIAANLLKGMEKVYPGLLDISDMFTYPTIKQMATQISKRSGLDNIDGSSMESESAAIAAQTEASIEEVMVRLAKGEISPEEAEKLIEKYSSGIK